MLEHLDDEDIEESNVSTGRLPEIERIQAILDQGYRRYRSVTDGQVADYIPALARASKDAFGASVTGTRGVVLSVGDAMVPFSIQSVSKPFVFALVCATAGERRAAELLGVNATGLPFTSVMAIELNEDRTMNPMVNAGAIATTSLIPGGTAEEKLRVILDGLSAFAGRRLAVNEEVYVAEAETNGRNEGIAHLLSSYGRLGFDPAEATDVYTHQCAIEVTATDLAVMGATLANGGVNPLTGDVVVPPSVCKRVLAVLSTAGLYERSGEWLFDIGLPGKSGVSGGIVTVAPGKGAIGVYSPPLDSAGNSVRGQRLTHYLSESLGLNLFTSTPETSTGFRGLRGNLDVELL